MTDRMLEERHVDDHDGSPVGEDIVLILRISMDVGTADLPIPRGAKPLDLALSFCGRHKLPADKVLDLMQHIEQQLALLVVPEINAGSSSS